MWRVKVYKVGLFGRTFVGAEVFTNKVDAMKYYNAKHKPPFRAEIEKWDPTKK